MVIDGIAILIKLEYIKAVSYEVSFSKKSMNSFATGTV